MLAGAICASSKGIFEQAPSDYATAKAGAWLEFDSIFTSDNLLAGTTSGPASGRLLASHELGCAYQLD